MKFYHMRRIFRNDWKRILTNPVALIVVLGIAVLPGLYAWVNIMACWNVYENTGNIPVAIVNSDKPAQLRDQEINIGASVVEQLNGNDKMDWKFVTEQQADLGLADGTYFAAIELPEDFSYNFTTLFSETPIKPKIIFKVDNKVNPVAERMTESA
ncbi:MAG TPA: YhgE/Pip domain-containing protein, partial [Peptococcaceae bacterium]|nr:YhgE/Pip domain-containing protein [Peptococcaceae bacterium]